MINRKYIAERVVGFAYPAFVVLSPTLPYYGEIEKAVKELGLKPEGDIATAAEIVDKVLSDIAEKMPKVCGDGYKLYKGEDGFWYFQAPGQEPEKITINIATWWESYVYHCGAMRYLGEELKKLGFDSKVSCTHARKLRDSKDWRYMHWHIYTYRRRISEDLLRMWFIDGMYWTYSSAALPIQIREQLKKMGDTLQPEIDKAIEELSKAKTLDELIAKEREVVKLVLKQSVVVAYVNPLISVIVSKRAHDVVTGWASMMNNPWISRLSKTTSGELRVGFYSSQMNLLTALNPRLAMHTVARATLMWPVVDVAVFPNPYTGELAPLRVAWSVERAKLSEKALFYDPYSYKWITVKDAIAKKLLNATRIEGERVVKIVYNYYLGKWHHGRDIKLSDVLLWLTWALDWRYNATEKEPWYFTDRGEHPMAPEPKALKCIYGIEIINKTALALYTSKECVGIEADDLVAEKFVGMINTWGPRTLWPWFPPELMLAIGYLKINGGPVTGRQYILRGTETENTKILDLLESKSVEDLKAALEKIASGEYEPPFVKAVEELVKAYPFIGSLDVKEGAKKLIDFANKYGHLLVSQGPFILSEFKPDRIVYTRFADYEKARSYESLVNLLRASTIELVEAKPVKPMIVAGEKGEISVVLNEKIVFPEEEAGVKPAEKAYVIARILKGGAEIARAIGKKVASGKWSIELPPEVTGKLEPGTYTVEILYGISPEAPLKKVTTTITILPPPTTIVKTATKPVTVTTPVVVTSPGATQIQTQILTKTIVTTKTVEKPVPTTITVTETNYTLAIVLGIVLL
ncbi:MAG TPA: hypothetical protein ENF93_01465, partial [Ignisphaera sp.]|nr:hypothetical protein [Ignisphaera sp.]